MEKTKIIRKNELVDLINQNEKPKKLESSVLALQRYELPIIQYEIPINNFKKQFTLFQRINLKVFCFLFPTILKLKFTKKS